MTEVKPHRLRRWVERASADPVDRRLGELFERVEPARPLDANRLAAVRMRLEQHRSSRAPWLLRHALLLAVGLLAGTGFALANYGVQRWLAPVAVSTAPAARPAGTAPSVVAKSPGSRRSTEPVPAASLAVPSTAQLLPGESGVPTRASTEPAKSPLGRETELLTRALTHLRSEGNPTAALDLLAQYRREFPAGALGLESDIARLDAFMALGRRAEALALLDALPIDRIGRGPELRVVRAELRARENPAHAVADFDAALAVSLPPSLHERALFGRGASRLHAGNAAGARADLTDYLRRYPNGRFAAEARAHTGHAERPLFQTSKSPKSPPPSSP